MFRTMADADWVLINARRIDVLLLNRTMLLLSKNKKLLFILCLWRSDSKLQELVLVYHVGSREQTHVVRWVECVFFFIC